MDNESIHHRVQLFLLMAIAFTMPFSIKLNSILIVICIAQSLFKKTPLAHLKQALANRGVVLMIAFFLVHLFSLFFSENQTEAWAIVERRLPLVAFPFLFFKQQQMPDEKKILSAFCFGISMAGLMCLAQAFFNYSEKGSSGFFYHQLSSEIGMSAIYLAAYYVFGIIILLNKQDIVRPGVRLGMITFFVVLCVLLSSKMLLIVLFVYLIVHAFNRIKQKKYKWIITAVTLVFVVGIMQAPLVKERFKLEFSSKFNVVNLPIYNYDTPFTGTTLRLTIWKQCYTIMKQENAWMFGIGTGDFQDRLNDAYKRVNMYTGNPQLGDTGYSGYGPHNQYIEVMLYGGIIGLFLLIMLLVTLLKNATNKQEWLFGVFVIFCSILFLSESILSTNKGLVFFSFFSALFLSINRKHANI